MTSIFLVFSFIYELRTRVKVVGTKRATRIVGRRNIYASYISYNVERGIIMRC